MTTTNIPDTNQVELDKANPNTLAAVLQKMLLGTMLSRIKVVVTAATAIAAIDLTKLLTLPGSGGGGLATVVVTGINLIDLTSLPPLLALRSLRVTASGTAGSVGSYALTDAAGTPLVPPGGASAAVGLANISDDGKTLTFPNTVTAFVIEYVGGPAVDMTATFSTLT